ncbi:dihydroflavonol-4-reductase [Cadophora sp. MPI-SDFR-AT-0126]|nr:dihydroflavonol-4-reductase [Leotiomycetes sp. MPI-SDFR-AT-0126]
MTTTLVTGGTGFIGLYVVKLLLERGHAVNTTVRSLKNPAKIKPLLDLQASYPLQLTLFEADLMKDGSFKAAMQGCTVVYHIASPFLVPQQIKDGLKDCVEPALQGTKNVLQSVNETETVTRVVLTSSIAAVYGDSADILKMKNATLTETYWNETSTISGSPYSYSKMIAEREAWKMQEAQSRWSLVTINPGLVLGPSLSPESASGSLFMLENMYKGSDKSGVAELHYPIADVREVAKAHVMAGENLTSKGRYIVAGDKSVSLLEMANFVRPIHREPKLLPTKNLPKMMIYVAGPFMGLSWKWVSANIGIGYKVDNSRSVKDLRLVYPSNEEVVRDHYRTWERTHSAKK